MATPKKEKKTAIQKAGPRTQKKKKSGVRVRSSHSSVSRRKKIPLLIHSLSISKGILLKTQRFAVVALRRPSGDIFVAATKLRPVKHTHDALVLLPVVRGISFLVELVSLYVFAASHNRSVEREYRALLSYWDRAMHSIQRSVVVLLWVFLSIGLAQFLLLYVTDLPVSSAHFVADMTYLLLVLFIFTVLFALVGAAGKAEAETLSYHIAAQKVLDAYERDGEVTAQNITEGSYVFDRTLVPLTFWTLFLFVAGLVLFNWQTANTLMSLLALIGIVGVSFGLAYEIVIQAERRMGLMYVVCIRPFLGLQALLAHRPHNSHFEVALVVLTALRSLEKR